MFVVVAQAAVGPTPVAPPPAVVAVPYGLCGGARKRKDVVQEEVAEGEGRGDGDDDDDAARRRRQQHGGHGLFVLETVEEEGEGDAEGERSSIGAVSDEEEGEEEVESKETSWRRKKKGGLTCLDALEDALPIKRGLSNFFSGKSRSFANLQDVTGTSARDVLAKPENPFNKRRRILRCTSIRRVSSTSLTALPPFLPSERPPCNNIGDVNVIHGGGGGG